MIKRIVMKKCASYGDVENGLDGCKKINFIYGANGSGKSTISNFLMNPNNPLYEKSFIEWDNSVHSEIKVYNKEFRKLNFKESEIPGVFTLGQASIEDKEILDAKKKELVRMIDEKTKREGTLEKKIQEKSEKTEKFKLDVWEKIQKNFSQDFQQAFDGLRGSKDKFFNELMSQVEIVRASVEVEYPQYDELKKRAEVIYKKFAEFYHKIDFSILMEKTKLISICEDAVWQEVIVGNEDLPIGGLIKELGNTDWVSMGQKYISSDSNICPFCQQYTLTESLKNQFKKFFEGEYKQKREKVLRLYSEYIANTKSILEKLELLLSSKDDISHGKIDETLLKAKINLLEKSIQQNQSMMEEKTKELGRKFIFIDLQVLLEEIESIISTGNQEIENHNEIIKNIKEEKSQLTVDVWKYCINEKNELIDSYQKDISQLDSAIKGISNGIKNSQKNIDTLQIEINEKGKKLTSIEPTIKEINRLLRAYGFTNFKVAPSKSQDNSYQIQREDGTLASNTLSEGEETFLTFLYFMQLIKGSTDAEMITDRKIIVLDDPISSLDSTILYIVSAMVKEVVRDLRDGNGDVEQIFVLTHNVFFHKEASFIDGRNDKFADINYWIIRKEKEISEIISYGMDNPISTSYELLWKEVREANISLISLQNTMRRIVENYFGMLGSGKDAYIEQKFETAEDQMICKSLFYWINDGSHTIPDDLYIDSYTDSAQKYKEVFHQIFVNTKNEAHYNMMMRIDNSIYTEGVQDNVKRN